MNETVTFELPEAITSQARVLAATTRRRFEDVLTEWIEHSVIKLPAELLSDEQVAALCDMQMPAGQQEVLSDLLARHREGQLSETETHELDRLMQVYRQGLVRKARAWKVAVDRGLKPSLGRLTSARR